ncbi:membrane protein [Candidatus Magnetomorum sp. HK-1]|nr:membrane protein [Candidatus Magnetomorum sp. HK-1]
MYFNDGEKKCLYDMGLLWSRNIKSNSSNHFRRFMYNRDIPINDSFVLCEKIENISTIISGTMLSTIYCFYSFLIIYLTSTFETSFDYNVLLYFLAILFFAISYVMVIYTIKAIQAIYSSYIKTYVNAIIPFTE